MKRNLHVAINYVIDSEMHVVLEYGKKHCFQLHATVNNSEHYDAIAKNPVEIASLASAVRNNKREMSPST